MKKITRIILISLSVTALLISLTAAALVSMVKTAMGDLKEQELLDFIHLRFYIEELQDRFPALQRPSEDGKSDVPATETVWEETYAHMDADTPTDAPALPLYVMAEYQGMIGIFDTEGQLVRTVNVWVDSLPAVDRKALTEGIPAYSEAEIRALTDKYE